MWREIRSRGFGCYMLRHGILGKTVPIISNFAIASFVSRELFSSTIPLMFWFVLTPLALAWGMIAAGLAWSKNEDRFNT